MFVTGPDVVKTVTHEVVTPKSSAAQRAHPTRAGVADLALATTSRPCCAPGKFFDFLPAEQSREAAALADRRPGRRQEPSLDSLIPAMPPSPTTSRKSFEKVADEGNFFETAVRTTRRTSSSASSACRAPPSAWWPISPWCWPAAWISIRPKKAAASSVSATRSTSRS